LRDEEKGKSRNSATCIGMSKGLDQPDQKGRQILRITHPIPLILQEIAEVQQLRRLEICLKDLLEASTKHMAGLMTP
jgi:hypothetical protein